MDQYEVQTPLKVKNSDGSETVHYDAFYEWTPNELKTFAERELGETQEKLARGMEHLKNFLRDKGLPQTDDVYLLGVLRNCKHDLKKSKVKLEKFLKVKELIMEKVAEFDLDKVDVILKDKTLAVLPYKDRHNRVIFMTQPTLKLELYSLNEVSICFMCLVLNSLTYPVTSLYGLTYIADANTPSFSLMYEIIMTYKTYVKMLNDLPLPIRRIDITNESVFVRWSLNIFRSIIPAKVFNRISMHGHNFETLKKVYHPDILPKEVEGNLESVNTNILRDRLLDFMKKLKEEHRAKITAEK